jgi:circadian clock protein KaiB
VTGSGNVPADTAVQPSATGADDTSGKYILRLYITGMTSRSARTIENLHVFCEKHLAGRYELQVIDVYQQPELASREQIVAVPTLIKQLPLPLRRLIGDMSDEERVLVGLDILPHH